MDGLSQDRALIVALVEWSGHRPAQIGRQAGGLANTTINRHFKGTATARLSQPTLDKLKSAYPDFPGWKDHGGSVEAEPPELPSADDFARILDALAPLAWASRENEAELRELGGHFRAAIEWRLQHPDYPIERILGSLDERLRARADRSSLPA